MGFFVDKTPPPAAQPRLKAEAHGREHIEHFFLDSGAHSLYTKYVINKKHKEGYSYFESKEFMDYVDCYAAFVKSKAAAIDYYANVDVIFNPELTWKIQNYLEKEHGLRPVPVVHYGTDIKWLKKYVESGHDYIGLGGLGQEVTKGQYYAWANQMYSYLCPQSNKRKPIVRTHGFAMTSWELLVLYPWYSTDSASWAKAAAYGMIYVPRTVRGVFQFVGPPGELLPKGLRPFNLGLSHMSPSKKMKEKHIYTLSPMAKRAVEKWLDHIGIPLGKVDDEGNEIEPGVLTHHHWRKQANLRFFKDLSDALPEWPWAYKSKGSKGFGL